MTVCVAIKVHDCIVPAADSAVSSSAASTGGVFIVTSVWKHGLKVFNLHRELPIIAMTAGLGNFSSMSVSNLAKEFRICLMNELDRERYTQKEAVDSAQRYFLKEYEKSTRLPILATHSSSG